MPALFKVGISMDCGRYLLQMRDRKFGYLLQDATLHVYLLHAFIHFQCFIPKRQRAALLENPSKLYVRTTLGYLTPVFLRMCAKYMT